MRFPLPVAAVVLDMDGTLLDTEAIYVGALVHAAASLGASIPDALCHAVVGLPGAAVPDLLRAHFGEPFDFSGLFKAYAARRDALLAEGVKLKPGATELLEHLAEAGLPAVVATSSRRASAEANLAAAGLLPRLAAVLTRDDVEHAKPWPDVFLRAAAAIGIAPASCVAVEDSHNGVRAAHAAGMMTVMVPDLVPANAEMREKCVFVVDDLFAVRDLLATNTSNARG